MPAKDVSLTMLRSCGVRVVVDFAGATRPAGYIVHMQPESVESVGTWSASGNVNAANRIAFHDVPPGKYILWGRPNPSNGTSQEAESVTIDLKDGQTLGVTLHAR